MESPGEPAPSFPLYSLLPCELRLGIIECWITEINEIWRWHRESRSWPEQDQSTGRPKIAKYATIDRQWKSVVEKSTFQDLWLRHSLSIPFSKIHALERICVQDRIWAFSRILLTIGPDRVSPPHRALSFATHATTNGADSTHYENDQSLINTRRVEAEEYLIRIVDRLQESRLRILEVMDVSKGFRARVETTSTPEPCTPPSLRLSQAMVAMTRRVGKLSLIDVVDVLYLLKESFRANGNVLRNLPTCPNLRYLMLRGYTINEPSDHLAFAAELYDAITDALPHMPNITFLGITLHFPFYVDGHRNWDNVTVDMTIPIPLPREDRSDLRDGLLDLHGPKPAPETMNKWKEVARRQWRCELQLRHT